MPRVPAALLLGAAYYAAAELGFALTVGPRPASVLRLQNALLLGALLLTPPRSWWVLLLAVLPAHLAAELRSENPVAMVLSRYVADSAEALFGASLLRLLVQPPLRLDRIPDAVAFVVVAGFVAPTLAAFPEAALVTLHGWGESPYWSVWAGRLLCSSLAALVTVPAILAWAGGGFRVGEAPPRRWAEAALLLAGLVGVELVAFARAGTASSPGLVFAPIPFILWAALRFGARGAGPSLLLLVLLSPWSSVRGQDAFASGASAVDATALQLAFIGTAVTLILLAAAVEERSRALEVARLRGEQLQLALDDAETGTWDWPVRWGAAELSALSRQILGIGPHTRVDALAHLVESVHPDDRLAVSQAILRSAVEGAPLEIEFRSHRPDGGNRWVLMRGKALLDARGRPNRLVGICADVTPRKLQDALDRRQHRILELIAMGAPLGTVLDRLVDLVESESPEVLCSILLLDRDGVHLRHGAAPHLPAEYVRAIDGGAIGPRAGSCGTAAYHGTPVVVEDIARDPLWDGYREVALRFGLRACWSTPIVSEEDRVLGTFAVYHREPRGPRAAELRLVDAGTHFAAIALERHRAELEAHEQRRTISHLGRVVMLGELSGALAHELRQPLSVILTAAQTGQRILRATSPDSSGLGEVLADIVAAVQRASEVIRRLGAMLRKGSVEQVALDANELARTAVELARGDLAARGVRVEDRLSPDLPHILGDHVGLQQVLLNLVGNACDAMTATPAADRLLTVETRYSAHEDRVELAISDRGTGIPADARERIFEPLFTLSPHGLGIGLAICRSIVRSHHGRLWAENNPEGGATFRVSLPCAGGDGPGPAGRETRLDAEARSLT